MERRHKYEIHDKCSFLGVLQNLNCLVVHMDHLFSIWTPANQELMEQFFVTSLAEWICESGKKFLQWTKVKVHKRVLSFSFNGALFLTGISNLY